LRRLFEAPVAYAREQKNAPELCSFGAFCSSFMHPPTTAVALSIGCNTPKKSPAMKNSKVPDIWIDPSFNKSDNVVLFPELLAKANALLKKAGPPKFEPKR
jgi:hypothetical protein